MLGRRNTVIKEPLGVIYVLTQGAGNQSEFFRQCRPVCYKFGNKDDKCQLFPTREGKANVCRSVYSGDTAPPLIALGARVKITGHAGVREILLKDLFTGNGKIPFVLLSGDILTEEQKEFYHYR